MENVIKFCELVEWPCFRLVQNALIILSYKERKQVRLILLAVGNIYYIYVLCYRYFERRGPFFLRILHTNDH